MENSNNRYKSFFVFASIIGLFISVAAIIWAGSKIDTKAGIAYSFVEKYGDLPSRVDNIYVNVFENTRKIEKFQEIMNILVKLQTKQEDICDRLEILTKDLKEMNKDNTARERDNTARERRLN